MLYKRRIAAAALACSHAACVVAQEIRAISFDRGAAVSSLLGDFRGQAGAPVLGKNAGGTVLMAPESPALTVTTRDGASNLKTQGRVLARPSGFLYEDAQGRALAQGESRAVENGWLIEVRDRAGTAIGAIRVTQISAEESSYAILSVSGEELAVSGPVGRSAGEVSLRDALGAAVAQLRRSKEPAPRWELVVQRSKAADSRVVVMLAMLKNALNPPSGQGGNRTGRKRDAPAQGASQGKGQGSLLSESQAAEEVAAQAAGPLPARGSPSAAKPAPPSPAVAGGAQGETRPARPSLFGFLRGFAEMVGHFFQQLLHPGRQAPSKEPAPSRDKIAPGNIPQAPRAPAAPPPASLALFASPLSQPSVKDAVMHDALGRQLLLRGINLSERSKRPPFAGWLKPEHADAVVRMGFDHVRFLLTWEAVEPKDGVYDEEYLAQVREEISWFEARGVYVILDMHQDQFSRKLGGDGMPDWVMLKDYFSWFPNIIAPFPLNYINPKVVANFMSFWNNKTKRQRLARAWGHVVSELKGCKALLGYDLLNEPFPGFRFPWDFDAKELSTLQAEITAAIRAEDSQRVVFLEPEALAAAFPFTGLKPADPNAVYAPHWYDPIVDIRAILGIKPAYDGDSSRTNRALDNLRNHARRMGIPMWLGEYGIERDRLGSAQYIRDHARLLDEKLISASYWELNPVEKDVFTFIDPDGKDYPLAAELARPHPRAVAGTLKRVNFDQFARRLEVEWSEGHLGPSAPTLIELPAKVFELGVPLDITLSDPDGTWRIERDPVSGRLAVWADPASAAHKIVIQPRKDGSV